MRTINGYRNIINLHNLVGADIIRPLNLHKFIGVQLVGCGDSTHRCREAVRYEFVGFDPTLASHNNRIFYTTRVSAFSFYLKKKRLQRKGRLGVSPRDPVNATPPYIARGSQSAARHIRTQTRWSLNECVLVRLASQAVPSPSSVSYYYCGAAIVSLIIKTSWSLTFTLLWLE